MQPLRTNQLHGRIWRMCAVQIRNGAHSPFHTHGPAFGGTHGTLVSLREESEDEASLSTVMITINDYHYVDAALFNDYVCDGAAFFNEYLYVGVALFNDYLYVGAALFCMSLVLFIPCTLLAITLNSESESRTEVEESQPNLNETVIKAEAKDPERQHARVEYEPHSQEFLEEMMFAAKLHSARRATMVTEHEFEQESLATVPTDVTLLDPGFLVDEPLCDDSELTLDEFTPPPVFHSGTNELTDDVDAAPVEVTCIPQNQLELPVDNIPSPPIFHTSIEERADDVDVARVEVSCIPQNQMELRKNNIPSLPIFHSSEELADDFVTTPVELFSVSENDSELPLDDIGSLQICCTTSEELADDVATTPVEVSLIPRCDLVLRLDDVASLPIYYSGSEELAHDVASIRVGVPSLPRNDSELPFDHTTSPPICYTSSEELVDDVAAIPVGVPSLSPNDSELPLYHTTSLPICYTSGEELAADDFATTPVKVPFIPRKDSGVASLGTSSRSMVSAPAVTHHSISAKDERPSQIKNEAKNETEQVALPTITITTVSLLDLVSDTLAEMMRQPKTCDTWSILDTGRLPIECVLVGSVALSVGVGLGRLADAGRKLLKV
ncbi:hypothetical protein HDU93_002503 [Gonapodya sp. JEL0774]|nr:hypothetical protein HDU93_002503 [Gonapodya sp. JEL0774]